MRWAPSDPREWSDFDGDGKETMKIQTTIMMDTDTDELRQKTDPFGLLQFQ